MKERPILMNGDSVRAILAGKKTQTRRVIPPRLMANADLDKNDPTYIYLWVPHDFGEYQHAKDVAPYQPGDLLWVKEAWMFWDWTEDGEPFIKYEADGTVRICEASSDKTAERWMDIWAELSVDENYSKHRGAARDNKWRSPMFMFRDCARIWLRVTGVRAERLQGITEADAIAEGALHGVDASWGGNGAYAQGRCQFLWDMLNAKRGYPWKDNPWVWVYEFKAERVMK